MSCRGCRHSIVTAAWYRRLRSGPGVGLRKLARLCELQLTCLFFGEAASKQLQRCSDSGGISAFELPLLSAGTSSSSGSSSQAGPSSSNSPSEAGAGDAGVYASVGSIGALAYAAAAKVRWLLLRGMFGVHGGLWWRRDAGRLD